MPLRHYDPFESKAARLDATVNPYVALLTGDAGEGNLPLHYGEGLRGKAGTWRETVRAGSEKLIVEIGCHKGLTLMQMAKECPQTAFIGIDITYKRVVTTAQRAVRHELPNVNTVMANARALDKLFAPREIDGVVMFFPDPWVRKKSQAKNRLVDDAFCEQLKGVLAADGFFWFKTDQLPYFEATTEALARAGFVRLPDDAPIALPRDYSSAFEQRFHEQNLPTYAGKWALGPRENVL